MAVFGHVVVVFHGDFFDVPGEKLRGQRKENFVFRPLAIHLQKIYGFHAFLGAKMLQLLGAYFDFLVIGVLVIQAVAAAVLAGDVKTALAVLVQCRAG